MKYLFGLLIFVIPYTIFCQCNGASQFPPSILDASNYNEIEVKAIGVYAGEYSIFTDFAPNKTYVVTSDSLHEDYITITTEASPSDAGYQVIVSGIPPINFIPVNSDDFYIHTNLALACGSESLPRTTSVKCIDCPEPQNIGIGTSTPEHSAALEIQSNFQGVLFPRHSTSSRDAIGDPSDGLVVFNSTKKRIETYNKDEGVWEGSSKSGKEKTIVFSYADFVPNTSTDEYTTHDINGIFGRGGTTSDNTGTSLINGLNLPIGSIIKSISYHYQDKDLSFAGIYVQFLRASLVNGSYEFLPGFGTLPGSDGGEQLRTVTYTINHTVENDFHYYINLLYTNVNRTIHGVKVVYTEPDL